MANTKTPPKSKTTEKKPLKTRLKKPLKETVFYKNLKCSFCGKSANNSYRLIALQPPSKICICDECIEVCIKILLDENPMFISRISNIFAQKIETKKSKPKKIQQKARNKKEGKKNYAKK